jgi:hypothetical protein
MPVHDLVHGYLDAVGGSAGAMIGGDISKDIYFGQAQWLIEGDGVAHSRLRRVGRYNYYFTEWLHGFHQGADTGRGDTIIIDYEYKGFGHSRSFLDPAK